MIVNILISFATFILETVLLVFPDSDGLPTEVSTAVSWIAGYVGILDPIIPIQTLSTVVLIVVAYELTIFAFKGLRWLISHIPFVGGRG